MPQSTFITHLVRVMTFPLFCAAIVGCASGPIDTLKHPEAALVRIRTTAPDGRPGPTAAGFLVSRDGLLFTALHLVDVGQPTYVTAPDRTILLAKVIEQDPGSDLAILQIPLPVKENQPIPFLKLQEADIIPTTHIRVVRPYEVVHGQFDHWENIGRDLALNIPLTAADIGAPVVDDTGHVVALIRAPVPGHLDQYEAIPVWRMIRMMPKLAE